MSFAERLRILIDVDGKGATSALGKFRAEVASANGVTGKLKAGVGSLAGSFKSFISSPMGAATAVTAVGAAMFKAVGEAQELALSVGEVADATGLSTEAASRWVEVANDMGISTDQVQGLISKLAVNLGKTPEAFAALGVEVQHAADGTVDMNATMLSAIGVLNAIKDPTDRAAAAQKLFGKSWQDAAELIGEGADSVAAKLAAVQDAKLVDPAQVAQAREMRDAMADLTDIGEDLTISLGKALIPILTDVAKGLKIVADAAGTANEGIEGATDGTINFNDVLATGATFGLYAAYKGITNLSDAVGDLFHSYGGNYVIDDASQALIDHAAALREGGEQALDFSDASKEAAEASYYLEQHADAVADEIARVEREAGYAETALRNLQNEIDGDQSWNDLQLNLLGIDEKLKAANEGFKDGSLDAEEYALTVKGITLDAKSDITDYLVGLESVPRSVISELLAEFDPEDIPTSIAAMQAIIDQYKLSVQIKPVAGGNEFGSTGRGGEDNSARAGQIVIHNAVFNSTQRLSPNEAAALVREWQRRNPGGGIGGSRD